ncbi:G-protein coupled receptor Mth2-like [Gigantopelta aegis]|uniref:G-protein coupled receptor Mth2-like n=1 Tax=Gigantopelta aegis TaxID=1735272 RepID=UPI001B887ED1|nr:G-protein coupled receptor Mth2-like [Gigantopelta aegis]
MAINALITVFDIRKKTTTVKLLNRFSVYSIYSWTGPALIVVPSILVDMFLVDSTFKPNYGMGLCWLTNTNALMMFFAGPLFIIILMNAIFFVIIATKISQGGDSNRHSDVKDKTNVFICMKLFLVIGLTWSVGFVANLIPHPVFWYLFIFLNTLQGLFIFLSFVATKQVWRLVRDRLVAVDGNSESSPSVVASSLTELPSHKASGIVAGKYDDMPVSKSQI